MQYTVTQVKNLTRTWPKTQSQSSYSYEQSYRTATALLRGETDGPGLGYGQGWGWATGRVGEGPRWGWAKPGRLLHTLHALTVDFHGGGLSHFGMTKSCFRLLKSEQIAVWGDTAALWIKLCWTSHLIIYSHLHICAWKERLCKELCTKKKGTHHQTEGVWMDPAAKTA